MHKIKTFAALAIAAALCLACKGTSDPEPAPVVERIPINISTTMPDAAAPTRATDFGFQSGDKVGLYVVNLPGTLASSGNHADNVPFTFSGSAWSSETQLYWKDDSTAADFYCYYPYSASVSDVTAYSVQVAADQSADDAYSGSDFLWGKRENVSPTPDPVQLTVNHITSRLKVVLKAGDGWTDADVAAAGVSITGVKTAGRFSLRDGSISLTGDAVEVKPHSEGDCVFKAYMLPQTVTDSPLVKIAVGDRQYVLDTTITFVSGKEHTCTVTVKRTSEGINIGIGAWETDDIDYGGTVE